MISQNNLTFRQSKHCLTVLIHQTNLLLKVQTWNHPLKKQKKVTIISNNEFWCCKSPFAGYQCVMMKTLSLFTRFDRRPRCVWLTLSKWTFHQLDRLWYCSCTKQILSYQWKFDSNLKMTKKPLIFWTMRLLLKLTI